MTIRTAPSHRSLVGVLLGAVVASVMVAAPASAAAPVDAAIDGSSQSAAAASCWEIKQNNPSAADGTYWLRTPQLVAPTRFYCDMTTDGGGWVLIGRGRDGWQEIHNGVGSPADVAGTVTGPAAFAPRQLDAHLIDGLVGGRRFDSMTDGLRLRRAANAAGTRWQESRLKLPQRDRWTWALSAGLPSSGTVDGTAFSGTTTRDVSIDNGTKRIWTFDSATNGYVRGFNYGSSVVGTTAASSYLYSKASGGTHATPFTQAYIRPRLLTSDLTYPAIGDRGTAETVAATIPRNGSAPTRWGVTGTGAAGTGENATEVQAFAQIGNVMYVGGNFTTVQKGASATGSDKVSQPYLAAFDATTGDYLSSFRPPALNNQVKALVALPGGKLAVGGEFTTVGSTKREGLVVLNGATGAVDTAWTTSLVNKQSGLKVSVRALDVGGDYLYVGGSMTHFQNGTAQVYAKGAGRIKISTRTPDSAWNPEFNGTVTGLDVSDDLSRVYFSGYFTQARTAEALRGAAFGTGSGAPRITPTWTPTVSTTGSSRYQQAVKEVGSRVWLGGAQHNLFGYDRTTFALNKAHITRSGGDVQAIGAGNGLVFQGNHSEHFNYSDTTTWEGSYSGNPNPGWSQADRMNFLGAYDAGTGDYVADFSPKFRARGGMGVWAITVASNGAVWAGGSLVSSISTTGANQWVGGFTRFDTRPHTAPGQPTQPTASLTDTTATVSWTRSGTAGASYEVLRGDRVVATTTGTSVSLPGSASTDRLFVRATDGAGNRSASTGVFSPASQAQTETLIGAGSTWSYLFSKDTAAPSTWKTSSSGTTAWKSGAAPLGFGSGPVTTDIDVPSGEQRGLTSYFRRSFTVADPAAFSSLTLTTRADDGVVVYVNGTEVGRVRMPTGTITPTSYATSAVNTAQATADPVVLDVPPSLLRAGDNTIAVEVHSNYRATPSSSMDLSLVGTS